MGQKEKFLYALIFTVCLSLEIIIIFLIPVLFYLRCNIIQQFILLICHSHFLPIVIIIRIQMNTTTNNNRLQSQHQLTLTDAIFIVQELLKDLIESEGNQCMTIFNSVDVPSISIQAYCLRIQKLTKYSPESLIIGLIYFDRYKMVEDQFYVNWNNVHKVFLTCLLLAVKFNDDIYYDNDAFSRAGGVTMQQLFGFEMEIFQKLNFNLFVSSEHYLELLQELKNNYLSQQ